jgi:hypothetical protein
MLVRSVIVGVGNEVTDGAPPGPRGTAATLPTRSTAETHRVSRRMSIRPPQVRIAHVKGRASGANWKVQAGRAPARGSEVTKAANRPEQHRVELVNHRLACGLAFDGYCSCGESIFRCSTAGMVAAWADSHQDGHECPEGAEYSSTQ